jgi:hypothetical protein
MVTDKREKFVTVVGWLSVIVAWTVVSATLLILGVTVTNPATIGPVGVTIWFLVLLGCLASIACLVLYTAKTFLHIHAAAPNRLRYSWRQGLLLGGWVSGLLALSTLRQLGALDAILLALLLLIVEVYVRFRWP